MSTEMKNRFPSPGGNLLTVFILDLGNREKSSNRVTCSHDNCIRVDFLDIGRMSSYLILNIHDRNFREIFLTRPKRQKKMTARLFKTIK